MRFTVEPETEWRYLVTGQEYKIVYRWKPGAPPMTWARASQHWRAERICEALNASDHVSQLQPEPQETAA